MLAGATVDADADADADANADAETLVAGPLEDVIEGFYEDEGWDEQALRSFCLEAVPKTDSPSGRRDPCRSGWDVEWGADP